MAKKVFITGASSGLGEGMARHLAARGYALGLAARRTERLEALAPELDAAGAPEVRLYDLDVTDYDSVAAVITRAAQEFGGLDIVIANAGLARNTPVGSGGLADIRAMIDTNLTGAIATIEAAVEIFRGQGHGQVVGISSVAAARGMRGQGAYSAGKAGLSRYLEALRAEVAGSDIVVTDLAPGYIDTDLNRSIKNRPFLVSAEEGTKQMVDMIEKQVAFSYVPWWPWTLVARILELAPTKLIARM